VRNLTVLGLAAIAFGSTSLCAQPSTPAGPAPTGLVVGSGNYFSPIVENLDKAVAFYRDGLGLDVQGAPGDAKENPALRNMFGLPDATLHWSIARTPALGGGVEIIEISAAGGKTVERSIQDSGAITLKATVRDLDATLARLKKLGAPVVTSGGAPVSIAIGGQSVRLVTLKDPAGHFVELMQPAQLPETQVPATANVLGVRVRLTVEDAEQTMRLYRDALGLKEVAAPGEFRADATVLAALGMSGGQYRAGTLQVPTSGLLIDVLEIKGVDRRTGQDRIQDFGATRMQLRVRDIDAAIAAFVKVGGEVVSTGGKPLDLPAGATTLKVAIVRDPDNLFVVLIQAPPPAG
jgi:catechol 2,3-dioxygenase-like lactoylglutathione lyase family enzyme